jgi:protein TonB
MRRFLDCILPTVLISIAACGGNASSPTTPSPPTPVYAIGDLGVSAPTVVLSVKPSYTAAAIAAHVQGRVLLSAVVTPDGTVGEVTVVQSLDTTYGLDAQAISAVKQWTFNPGMKGGTAVAVRVSIEMTFTLA